MQNLMQILLLETATDTATQTPADPDPTLDDFAYPAGADREGLDAANLYSTHRSTITDTGSVTVQIDEHRRFERLDISTTATNALSSDESLRTVERDDVTESLWSPASEDVAYVQMDTGFEQRYRIDNTTPSTEEIAELPRFKRLLTAADWSEVQEIVKVGEDTFAAVYEAVGIADEQPLLRVVFVEQVSEFVATVAVSESGYVADLQYDLTVERTDSTVQDDAALEIEKVGSTTVEEPSWADTARDEGVRFSVAPTDDQRALELEMVNGEALSDRTSVSVSSRNWGPQRSGRR